MITKNIYDMPYPSAVPTTMTEVKAYIDTFSAWLAEKLGLVVREDLTADAPEYGQYSYFKYLAKNAQSDPYLGIYCPNYDSSSSQKNTVVVAPVKKVNNYFRPIQVTNTSTTNPNYPQKARSNIIVNYSGLGATYKHSLIVITFDDGRKIGIIRSIQISTGNVFSKNNESLIYFGKILMQGNEEETCVVIADGPNSAWMEEYEQCATSTEVTSLSVCTISNYASLLGLVYSGALGKSFFIKQNYCIGEDAYIPNIIQYADFQNVLNTGTIISIDNKKYVCVYAKSVNEAVLLMPEEVE